VLRAGLPEGGVSDSVTVAVFVAVAMLVGELVSIVAGVLVGKLAAIGVRVRAAAVVEVSVLVGQGVSVAVGKGVGVVVEISVAGGLGVGVLVAVAGAVAVGVAVGVGVDVTIGVRVGVEVEVGVGAAPTTTKPSLMLVTWELPPVSSARTLRRSRRLSPSPWAVRLTTANAPDPLGPACSPKLKAPKVTFPAPLSMRGPAGEAERPVLPRKVPSVTPSTLTIAAV